METSEEKKSENFKLDEDYEYTWVIERNNEKITIDIGFCIGYSGEAILETVYWGGEEFNLTFEEERSICDWIEHNVDENFEGEDDEDE